MFVFLYAGCDGCVSLPFKFGRFNASHGNMSNSRVFDQHHLWQVHFREAHHFAAGKALWQKDVGHAFICDA